MTATSTTWNSSDIAVYRQRMLHQQHQYQAERLLRLQRAWVISQQAADVLKQPYGVKRVWLFGSLAHQHWFGLSSDIDLAIYHLPIESYLVAVARLQDIAPEFKIDLIQLNQCSSSLKETILREGKLL